MEKTQRKIEPAAKKRWCIFGVEVVYLYLFGIFVAFLGWAGENLAGALTKGVVDSRFHLLPFISPYALIPLAIHIVLGDPDDLIFFGKRLFGKRNVLTCVLSNLICYVILCITVFLGELAVGNLWDVLFDVRLWDYRGWPLTLTQYTSIVTTVGFGTAAYLVLRFIYKPLLRLIRTKVPFRVARGICLTLGVVIVLDTGWMILHMALYGTGPVYWSLIIENPIFG